MTRVVIAGILLTMLVSSLVILGIHYSSSRNKDVTSESEQMKTVENMVQYQPQLQPSKVIAEAKSTEAQPMMTPAVRPTLSGREKKMSMEAKAGSETLSNPVVDYLKAIEEFQQAVEAAEAAVERLEGIDYE